MKIKNNITEKPITFDDLEYGDLFLGVPYEGVPSNEIYMKIYCMGMIGLELEEGAAIRLSDGTFFEFRDDSGVKKVDGTLTIEDLK